MKSINYFLALGLIVLTQVASAEIYPKGLGDVSSIQSRRDGLFNVICKDGRYQEGVSEEDIRQDRVCSPVTAKIDILFVVDNSGSMASAQVNLARNFPTVLDKLVAKKYDFQIAVTTTDAYLAGPAWTPYYNQIPTPGYYEGRPQMEKAWFRSGTPSNPSPYRILTGGTPDLHQNFILNVTQGVSGHGDERSFQSLRAALESTGNSGFVRPGSFLAIVILTDEDDFSHDGTNVVARYDYPGLHTVDTYVQLLDRLTGSISDNTRRYSVNTVSVNSQECLNSIYNGAQKIAVRVGHLADATGGIKGNICGDFAAELELIFDSVTNRLR